MNFHFSPSFCRAPCRQQNLYFFNYRFTQAWVQDWAYDFASPQLSFLIWLLECWLVTILHDFRRDNELKRYLWCSAVMRKLMKAHKGNIYTLSNILFFPSSNKEGLWSIQFSWSQEPSMATNLLPPSAVLRHTWGSGRFHRELEVSFLRLLFKINGLICSAQGLGNIHLDPFFISLQKYLLIYLYYFRIKAHIFPIHVI